MSFTKITDINSKININLEDALSLLLASIALEEVSLSKLLNVETNKLLYVLDECNLERFSNQDVLEINTSINRTITNMIRLQTMLQLKMDGIVDFLPATPSESPPGQQNSTPSLTEAPVKKASIKKGYSHKKGYSKLEEEPKGSVSRPLSYKSKKSRYPKQKKTSTKKENPVDEKVLLYIILLLFLGPQ